MDQKRVVLYRAEVVDLDDNAVGAHERIAAAVGLRVQLETPAAGGAYARASANAEKVLRRCGLWFENLCVSKWFVNARLSGKG